MSMNCPNPLLKKFHSTVVVLRRMYEYLTRVVLLKPVAIVCAKLKNNYGHRKFGYVMHTHSFILAQ